MEERERMDKPLRDLIEIIQFTGNVSAKIHGLLDGAEIYRTVNEEFAKSKRYTASIVLLTDDGSKLRIVETSIPPGQLKAGEKASGLRLKGFKVDLNKSSIYSQVVRGGKTVQANVSDIIGELFPRPLAYLISKTMGYEEKKSILTPLKRYGEIIGAFAMTSPELAEYFIPSVRNLAQHISTALELADEYAESKRAERYLSERVKELNCLYGIARITESPGITLDELYQEVANLLPASWQYPEIACAKIIIDGKVFKTGNYRDSEWKQTSDIKVHGAKAGTIEIGYLEERPVIDEGTFLKEERLLLDAIAERLGRITERKKAEEALRKSEEDWRSSFNSLEDVMLITDKDYNIENINDNGLAFLGKSREEVIGKKCYQIISGADGPAEYCPCRQSLKTKKVESVDRYEERFSRYFSIKSSPIFDENGEVIKFVDLRRDITERKQAEEELRESKAFAESLIASMKDGFSVLDDQGVHLSVNPALCQMTGFTKEELVGTGPPHGYWPEEAYEQIQAAFQKTLGGQFEDFELTFKRKNGERFPVIVSPSWIRDKDANVISYFATVKDITERKRAEEERGALLKDLEEINRRLEQSNKELQDFAYIASHDLREPLRKISSFGALLQDSLEGKLDEDQKENLEFMIDGAKRMQEMIDDLLTYSRITTRAEPPERVDLNEMIEDVKSLILAALLDETKGTIHVPEPLPPVQGDSLQMHQLFQNLIGNGLKFHREGIPPEITIRAHQIEGNMVRVEVQDNGIGIEEKYQEQVFTMLKRLHAQARYKGTGIGLAICKKVVERHGGSIGVKSTPGEGSTFWFTLPRGSRSGDE